ncbi:hypothetical protein HSB1_39680 [Halogranum salarium B-1]|uniref:Uncharacterized protein n=1 Tax=Halogranum salarium B-1 TaxID=1210908 RepID=J3ETS1_9EURY|nr:hypothetical protein HSB1_39680 [Halogranum salarium B-1]
MKLLQRLRTNDITETEFVEWCSVQRRACYSRLDRLEGRTV